MTRSLSKHRILWRGNALKKMQKYILIEFLCHFVYMGRTHSSLVCRRGWWRWAESQHWYRFRRRRSWRRRAVRWERFFFFWYCYLIFYICIYVAGNILAHAFFPRYGGDVHFDEDELWSANKTSIVFLFSINHKNDSFFLYTNKVENSKMFLKVQGWYLIMFSIIQIILN